MRLDLRQLLFAAPFASFLAEGCGRPMAAADPSSVTPSTAEAMTGLLDANIVATIIAANAADILGAELALATSQDADVRAFATMVRKDHQAINDAAIRLVTRRKVTPEDNETSLDLRDDAETTRLGLRDLEGFAFDSAYLATEVAYHSTVLGMIDRTLLPSAGVPELRALLGEIRPAMAAHLKQAEVLAALKTTRP